MVNQKLTNLLKKLYGLNGVWGAVSQTASVLKNVMLLKGLSM